MTLVKKTFLVFGVVFIIQLAVVALLVGLGYRQSEDQWQQVRSSQAYDTAKNFLVEGEEQGGADSYTGPLAIYDANRQLLGSSRGWGMHGSMGRNMMAQMKPIYVDSVLVGYYATGEESFSTDIANKTLLRTMVMVLLLSLLLSLGIALIAALFFSRKVARPADNLARSLHEMTQGNFSVPVKSDGSDELVRIGQSIESLRLRLLHERTVRSQWSQDIAHDLRTPVASVKAQLEGMIDGILTPDVARFERTMRELQRMEILVDDLETLMRLESPEAEAKLELIDCNTMVRELGERFEAQLLQSSMHLDTEISCDQIMADEVLLTRALSNLISNAIRYGVEGTPIRLRVSQKEGGTLIAVHNSGNPIPPQEIPKLTERLYRGEFARSTQGSGLGLTIVDRIAQLHNGSLTIESTKENGTTMTIVLPSPLSAIRYPQ
jgi:two-component system sensor histidine kinase BaeS